MQYLMQGADNSMIYTYKLNELQLLHAIFIPDHQFQKVFFMFPWVIILFTFLWRPLSCGGPWETAQFPP